MIFWKCMLKQQATSQGIVKLAGSFNVAVGFHESPLSYRHSAIHRVLAATSNTSPRALYRRSLRREYGRLASPSLAR